MPDLSLDLRNLRYAIAASQHRSFRRAATSLNISQSTLSRRVQLLEHRIGFRIFDRGPNGVRLTRAGQLFLEEASAGMQKLGEAIQLATSVQTAERGELQIGVLVPLTAGRLHHAFKEFHKRHPKIRVSLYEGSSEQNLARLVTGELDISFLPGMPTLSGHDAVLLWTESIYVALPHDHRLAQQEELTWQDLREETFIVSQRGVGPEIRDYLVRKLSEPGFRPKINVHDVSRESLMNIVAMGYGITLASASVLGGGAGAVTFRPISGDPEQLPSTAVWSPNNSNPALMRLLCLVMDVAVGRVSQVGNGVNKFLALLISAQVAAQSFLGVPAQILDPFV